MEKERTLAPWTKCNAELELLVTMVSAVLSFYSIFLVSLKMQLFYKIVASDTEINISTYSILLKNLLSAGNWRKYIEVTHNSKLIPYLSFFSSSLTIYVEENIILT